MNTSEIPSDWFTVSSAPEGPWKKGPLWSQSQSVCSYEFTASSNK